MSTPKPWILDEEPSLEIMKAAWDLGINMINTANFYSRGESERLVAKFMKKYQIPRNRFVVASKYSLLVADDISVRTQLAPHLNEQRHLACRLETTYLNLLQITRYDPLVPAEETMKALHDLVESGKVRYIGASSMRCWQFAHLNEVAEKNGWTKFVSMQNEYSLLYCEEREMLAHCEFHGIGVIPWSPLPWVLHRRGIYRKWT
ncbi:Aldo/keto reductase, partial [Imleria badia]